MKRKLWGELRAPSRGLTGRLERAFHEGVGSEARGDGFKLRVGLGGIMRGNSSL